MKQVVITGGKGGCGKTTVAAAFASLAKNWVIADCDVDSPNLGIIAEPDISARHDFPINAVRIDPDKCSECGLCREKCKFDAVTPDYRIDPISCESCGLCVEICPTGAAEFFETKAGIWEAGECRFGPFLDAELMPGMENSGKLVTIIREEAKDLAGENYRGVLVDGPPGAGCPVIASITGCDLALAVTEPTVSGIHDLSRLLELCETLSTPVAIILNKVDISEKKSGEIRRFAAEKGLDILAELPYDTLTSAAQTEKKSVVELDSHSPISMELSRAWGKIRAILEER